LSRALDLTLPDPERGWAAGLAGRWDDLLYAPGPGFASPLEPGVYRSALVIVTAAGPALRVSSHVMPAFGGDLCRLRIEPLASYRREHLGSFFEPARRGIVYAMSADRRSGGPQPPDRPEWAYPGPSLAPALGEVTRVRVLRERAAARDAIGAIGWMADRGLALTGRDGTDVLLLAHPDDPEQVALICALGLHRPLLDPTGLSIPGATPRELLGYGDRDAPFELTMELEPLPPPTPDR
jgi:hypothetical protein